MNEEFREYHDQRNSTVESGDPLLAYIPEEKGFIESTYPDEFVQDKRQPDELFGSQIPLEAAARYVLDNSSEDELPEEKREELLSSNVFQLIGFNPEGELAKYIIRRASSVEVDGIGTVSILNDYLPKGQEFAERFREDTGLNTPTESELAKYAFELTGNDYQHGIHEAGPDPSDSKIERTGSAREYVNYVQNLYDEIWGAAPRGRGIGGGGLPENRLDLIEDRHLIRASGIKIARKVAPETVDEFLYNDVMSDLEDGTELMMRASQQWTPDPTFFSSYGEGKGHQKSGVIVMDSDTDNILTSGLVNVGNPKEIEDISPNTVEFPEDKIVKSQDFKPIDFALWSIGEMETEF